MNAIEYTRNLRRLSVVSWVGSLVFFLCLSWVKIIPLNEFLPFIAVFIGTIPIVVFVMRNKVCCDVCGGHIKFHPDILVLFINARNAVAKLTLVFILIFRMAAVALQTPLGFFRKRAADEINGSGEM